MLKLKEKYNCVIGYSGHESSVSPSFTAAVLGAVIERHITLDRAMYGSDQSASLSFDGMKNLSNQVKLDKILVMEKNNYPFRTKSEDKLRYW